MANTKAERILELLQDDNEPTDEDIAETFLDGEVPLFSIKDLILILQDKHGRIVAEEFTEFACKGKIPAAKTVLIEFFTGREDVISKMCLTKLMEAGQ